MTDYPQLAEVIARIIGKNHANRSDRDLCAIQLEALYAYANELRFWRPVSASKNSVPGGRLRHEIRPHLQP